HYGFYARLGAGDSIGEGFLAWAQANIYPGMSADYKYWYYGLNILGDGTLCLHGGSRGPLADSHKQPAPPDGDFDDWHPVSTSAHSDIAPALLGTGDGAVCAWVSAEQGRSSIYTSLFDGDSWSAPRPLDYATYWEYQPALARTGDGCHCVFTQFDGDTYDYDLWYASSADGGAWGTPARIGLLDGYDLYPALAADASDRLWLVWQSWGSDGAYLRWSRYNGTSWTPPAAVSGDEAGKPALCRDGDDGVYLACQYRDADGSVSIRVRHNDGSGWGAAEAIDGGGGRAANPTLFRDSEGILWCAFEGVTDETTAVFVASNDGSGWTAAERVTPLDIAAHAPSLAEGGLGAWCVYWANDGSGRYAYVSKYNPDYDAWFGPTRLSDEDAQGWAPVIAAADSGLLIAAWHQYSDGDLDVVAGSADDSSADEYAFSARGTDEGVLLTWLADPGDAGYTLYREAEILNDQPLRGSGRLNWLDRSEGGRYWLEILRADGGRLRVGPVEAERLGDGPAMDLSLPYPSPARDAATFSFTLSEAGPVELTVFDLAGRRVATPVNENLTGGRHEATWDCASAPSGVYLYRLVTESGSLTRRLVVSR
ncbi:MAG: T9SS type A sorting domain-containing protein, partial [bacterium]|nr:T9SS type A sorting domain-containing protein [bacterium]